MTGELPVRLPVLFYGRPPWFVTAPSKAGMTGKLPVRLPLLVCDRSPAGEALGFDVLVD